MELTSNPWRLHQDVKPGQAQLISEAWNKHCRDRRLVSLSAYEVNEIYAGEWEATVNEAQNDVFLTSVVIGLDDDTSPNEDASQNVKNPSNAKLTPNVNKFKNDSGKFVKPKTFMSEIYTTTQRVTKAAQQRGHVTGSPLSLETGWNFLRSHDREVARKLLSKEIPYFLVIAFPCSFWSILLNLNPPKDHERRLKEAMQLLRFAIQLARDQHARGLHFVLENPQSSRAWSLDEMQKALSALQARLVGLPSMSLWPSRTQWTVGPQSNSLGYFERLHRTDLRWHEVLGKPRPRARHRWSAHLKTFRSLSMGARQDSREGNGKAV